MIDWMVAPSIGLGVLVSQYSCLTPLPCVESFFGTLKRELVYHRHYATRDEATQEIFECIEVFYNRQRRHSTLGYDSPAEYEAKTVVA